MENLGALLVQSQPPPSAEIQKRLKPFGFRKPARAWKELSAYAQNSFDRSAWLELLPFLLFEFAQSPDPDQSLNHFSTFASVAFHRSQLFQYLSRNPMARKALAQVFGLSPALTTVLCREPALVYWLFEEEGVFTPFRPEKLSAELDLEVAQAEDEEGKLNTLRRVKARQMLRLGVRDLLNLTDVKDLTFEMAGLADALVEKVVEVGRTHFGPGPEGSFCVLGLGKLGGRELNYSSDIDPLFVYDTPLQGDEGEKARRYFNDLAEWVIHILGEPTPLGNIFRVDMRLRPEGLGDMARSLPSYLEHYEVRSQPWELQALLKARPCAGDLELGERFLKEVEPFIFRKNYDSVYLAEIREIMDLIKQKMESKGRLKTQVKLGKGGIREIEFIVQFLQLVHGGARPEVRNANSLEALEILGAKGILLKADAQFLAESYRFLRNIEHHLQMVHGLQTHTLPKKTEDLERLARSLGFRGGAEGSSVQRFKAQYAETTKGVRALYEEVFQIKKRRDPFAQIAEDAMTGDLDRLEELLAGAGFFHEPRQAGVNLKDIFNHLRKTAGSRGERQWNSFATELLAGLKKVSHPDRALNQMERFLKATSLPDLYVRYLLEKPALRKLLLDLFSQSIFLTEILIRQPGNFDIVLKALAEASPQSIQDTLDPLEDLLAETPDWEEKLNRLRDLRNSEVLRVGLQDLLGKRDLFESFAELSRLAQAVSRSALGIATEKMDIPILSGRPSIPKGFCVFAMGKLGGREMNYGSDLDLLFIYGDEEGKGVGFETYLKLAETFTQALASPTSHGMAYKIDARLRPMGREAMMVHSVEAYRRYFQTYGQPAERLAYTRAVFMAGDRQVGFQAKEVIERFVYSHGLTKADLDSILDIRSQMEEKAKKAEGIELKVSPGGIVDVEFLVQTLQVAYGKDRPLLRMPHLPTTLGYLGDEGLLPKEVAVELLEAYRFYRLIEARHRMVRETGDDELPTDLKRLKRLAWRMGGAHVPSAEELVEKIQKTQVRVRELFQRLPEWVKFERT